MNSMINGAKNTSYKQSVVKHSQHVARLLLQNAYRITCAVYSLLLLAMPTRPHVSITLFYTGEQSVQLLLFFKWKELRKGDRLPLVSPFICEWARKASWLGRKSGQSQVDLRICEHKDAESKWTMTQIHCHFIESKDMRSGIPSLEYLWIANYSFATSFELQFFFS